MNANEIAALSARVSIDGVEQSVTKLGLLDTALGRSAGIASKTGGQIQAAADKNAAAIESMVARQKKSLSTLKTATMVGGAAVTAAVAGALTYGIKLNAQWESNQAAFATFLGSAKEAVKFTERLRSVSSKSPLKLSDYSEAAKMLMGYGMATKKIIPTLSAVNKAIVTVGKGSEEMKRVVLAIGQMQGAGKATGEELRQLAEVGVPVNKILQRELGLSAEKVKNIGEESISSGKVIDAIVRGWNKDFSKGYANAANTFNFQMASAQKTFEQFLRLSSFPVFEALRKDVLPAVNTELGKLIDIIDNPRLTGQQKWARVGVWAEKTVDKIGDLANEAMPKIAGAIQKALPVIGRATEKLTPIFAEALGRIVVAAVPIGVSAGGNLAMGLIKGFAESDLIGKAFLATMLFRSFGGYAFLSKKGMGIGTLLAGAIGKAFSSGTAAFDLAGMGTLAKTTAGVGAAGQSLAGSLMGGLAKAIPIAAAAYAIGDIASTAITGDTKGALVKAGGALVGGGIGFAVGGPVGAAIGAGIGTAAAGAISGLFGGGGEVEKTLRQQAVEGQKRLVAGIRAEVASVGNLRAAVKGQVNAREQQRKAAERVSRAENALNAARRRHGPTSERARAAEARYRIALDDSQQAEARLRRANRLQGAERRATTRIMRDNVQQAKANIVVLKQERVDLRKQRAENNRNNGSLEELRQIQSKLRQNSKSLDSQQDKVNRTIQKAGSVIGPKFARSLEKISSRSAVISRVMPQLGRVTSSTMSSTRRDTDRANLRFQALGDVVIRTRRTFGSNMRGASSVTRQSMSNIMQSLQDNLEAIQATGAPQAKRSGGMVSLVPNKKGNNVPVRVSPGEVWKTPDGRHGQVPGRPTARDSVLTSFPVNTKIFTFDGQRMLAAGASESEALRRQAPHFKTGGLIPKPTVTGSTPLGRKNSQSAIDSAYRAAKKRWAWIKRHYGKRTLQAVQKAANRIDALGLPYVWGGGHGSTPAPKNGPFDCSGAISRVIQEAGWNVPTTVSGSMVGWGSPGRGEVSILANPEHVYGVFGGRAWGTSGENPGGGAGWINGYTYRGGFTVRHMPTLGEGQQAAPGYRDGGNVKGMWAGSKIDKVYPKSDGYSGARLPAYVIKALAQSYGLPGTTMYQITQGESMGHPGVDISDPPGRSRGLYAVNDHYNPQYNATQLRNPIYATWAAAQLAGAAGGPNSNIWHGDSHVTGWDLNYDADQLKLRRIAWRLGGDKEGQAQYKKGKRGLRAAKRIHGRTGGLGGKFRATARKRTRRAAKYSKLASKAALRGRTGKARQFNAKARRWRKAAKHTIARWRKHQSQTDPGVLPGRDSGPGLAPGPGPFDPTKDYGPGNFPGAGQLPPGTMDLIHSPDIGWSKKREILDGALAQAQQTDSTRDDAAVYGRILRMEQARLSAARRKVKGSNKLIAILGGRKRLKALRERVRSLSKREAKLEAALGRLPIGKKGAAARKKLQRKLRGIRRDKRKWAQSANTLGDLVGARDTALTTVGDAQSQIGAAKEGLTGLNETDGGGSETGATQDDLLEAINALKDEMARANALAEKTGQISGNEIGRAVKDWLSGELVGQGAGFGVGNTNVRR